MTKEDAFKELLNILKVMEDNKRYPNAIFYFKNKECYFLHNKKFNYFWCNYEKIWSIFETKYGMNDQQIQEFIKEQVEEHFNFMGLIIPNYLKKSFENISMVEEHFNKK